MYGLRIVGKINISFTVTDNANIAARVTGQNVEIHFRYIPQFDRSTTIHFLLLVPNYLI